MAGRLVAVWLLLAAMLGLLILAGMRAWTAAAIPTPVVVAAAVLTLVAGALASRGRLRGASPGARDNATGLLAALVAAEAATDPAVGILVTGAEEFGLVGARAFARTGPGARDLEVVNFDTLTDRGDLYLVVHDRKGEELARRLAASLSGTGPRVVIRRLPPGILTDSLPLANAGARAVTISRLDWSVLRLIHTPRDTAAGLDPGAAELAGRVVGKLPAGIDQPGGAA
jgi:Zn-dependent M28 family amino/carboxypeptidase